MRRLILLLVLLAPAVFCQNIAYTYDASGRLVLADYGNGNQIQYTYDNAGNLLTRTVVTASATGDAKAPKRKGERPKPSPEKASSVAQPPRK